MVKQQIYDPITKKIKLLDPLGRKAKEIYKYKINQGEAPGSVLPPELTLINGRFKKVKNLANFNNVRRITYQNIDQQNSQNQLSWLNSILKTYQGKTIQVAYKYYVLNDAGQLVERSESVTYDVPKTGDGYGEFWRAFYLFLRPIDSDSWIFSEEYNKSDLVSEQTQLIIMSADKVGEENYQQFFLDGVTHCVFTPIKLWAEQLLKETTNKKTAMGYQTKLNKINKFEKFYKDGVPDEDFQSICNSLDIGIKIDTPSTMNTKTKFIEVGG